MLFDLYIPIFYKFFNVFFFFLNLNLKVKSADFVLSSPKWILGFGNLYLTVFQFCYYLNVDKESSAYKTALDISLAYIKNRSDPKIESWDRPQHTDAD